jgi:hypothetical protein
MSRLWLTKFFFFILTGRKKGLEISKFRKNKKKLKFHHPYLLGSCTLHSPAQDSKGDVGAWGNAVPGSSSPVPTSVQLHRARACRIARVYE